MQIRILGVALALLVGNMLPAVGQETPSGPATTQPASQATGEQVHHLRSPYSLMQRFLITATQAAENLAAAEAAAATQPTTQPADEAAVAVVRGYEHYREAIRCLDFSTVSTDQAELHEVGPVYVRQLSDIVQAMMSRGCVDLEDEEMLPKKAATKPPQSLPCNQIVLRMTRLQRPGTEGSPVFDWKFSPETVASIPAWHEKLDELLEPERAPAPVVEVNAELRSPRGLVRFFLERAQEFKETKDADAFQAALACLDLSLVVAGLEDQSPEAVQQYLDEHGPGLILGLERILGKLLSDGDLQLEQLHDQPQAEHKGTFAIDNSTHPEAPRIEVLLVRRGNVADGTSQWQFSSDTVARIPDMAAKLSVEATRDPRATPRATLATFLSAMHEDRLDDAAMCLNTGKLEPGQLELVKTLAGKLLMILARRPAITLQTVPDDPAATEPYVILTHRAGRIEIGPTQDPDRPGEWLFTPRTVEDIEPLYEVFQDRPLSADWHDVRLSFTSLPALYLREYVIPTELKHEWLGLKLWQWIGVPTILLVGWVIYRLLHVLLPALARWLLRTEGQAFLRGAFRKEMRPVALLAMALMWWIGFLLLDLGTTAMTSIFWVLRILVTVTGAVAGYHLVGVVMSYAAVRASRSRSRVDDVLVPLIEKSLKVVAIALGIVFMINVVFGVAIETLFAGLGIGGFAVAFAAQDTIKNFFGSVNVVLDRPFQVGDWVKIGGTEGIIESVGLRSSKIRTFWKSQIVVPNSEIMNATIENFQRRTYRRTFAQLSVTYSTTPEQLEAFCEGIREIIRQHPHTWKDYFHVYVSRFNDSSIDIMLYCFHDVDDWGKELAERHRLFLDIIRLAQRLGVDFAFPTRTLHMYQEQAKPSETPMNAAPQGALEFGREQALEVLNAAGGARPRE